jgi:O-antigen/teichoic acid export membrane protein
MGVELNGQQGLVEEPRLARNVIWNLLGLGLPPLIGIVAIPSILNGIGIDRFGILTIAWAVLGYFSVFDLGIGRALTKLVAEKLGLGEAMKIPALIWTALVTVVVLGLTGVIVLTSLTPWLVQSVLKIPPSFHTEAANAFYLLAFSIPFVMSTAALRGILEAHQRFGLVNIVRSPLGMLTFLGPLIVLPFSNSLVPIVGVMAASHATACAIYGWLCLRVVPQLRHKFQVRWITLKELLVFGGWLAVTNVVGPVMVYMDRFFISAIVSIGAVAYYATPFEVVTRLLIFPSAIIGVAYPAFSTSMASEPSRAGRILWQSVNYIFLALFPLTLIIVGFSHDALRLWLGASFADRSAFVLQWLAAGVLLNSLAYAPFAFMQGAGFPHLSAKIHLIELPIYLLALWWLLGRFGIDGAAIAWAFRVGLDALLFFIVTGKLLPGNGHKLISIATMAIIGIVAFVFVAAITNLTIKVLFVSSVLILTFWFGWRILLTPGERQLVQRFCRIRAE